MFDTPILFLVFNRPDTTRQVFERIRQIRPRQLFVAADGFRENVIGEKQKTEAVRKIITDNIDWNCEIKTLFRDQNLGCGKAVSEGINWFFNKVEQGIILEDDTLPDLSFFSFCEELLNYHKENEQIMLISGSNFQGRKTWGKSSYFYSNYFTMWGWASWRRAWQYYDFDLDGLDNFTETKGLEKLLQTDKEVAYWQNLFESFRGENKIDTWDYQWIFSVWQQGGLTATSNKNLITNIGFDEDATHTVGDYLENIYKKKTSTIHKVTHPESVRIYPKADLNTFQNFFHVEPRLTNRLKNFVKKGIKKIKG